MGRYGYKSFTALMSVFVFHRGVLLPWVPMLMVGKMSDAMSDECQTSVNRLQIDIAFNVIKPLFLRGFLVLHLQTECKSMSDKCQTNVR